MSTMRCGILSTCLKPWIPRSLKRGTSRNSRSYADLRSAIRLSGPDHENPAVGLARTRRHVESGGDACLTGVPFYGRNQRRVEFIHIEVDAQVDVVQPYSRLAKLSAGQDLATVRHGGIAESSADDNESGE